jgi:aspartyl-tRNA(Asn)/glutamyl-tRNA(Gln) amidotransferase subunit C
MEFTPADVKRIAHLARIAVSDEEAESMRGQLTAILALIEEMQAVDTAGIEPMAHAQDLVLRLREDRITEVDRHEAFQQIAPAVERGLYLVPKVIE